MRLINQRHRDTAKELGMTPEDVAQTLDDALLNIRAALLKRNTLMSKALLQLSDDELLDFMGACAKSRKEDKNAT